VLAVPIGVGAGRALIRPALRNLVGVGGPAADQQERRPVGEMSEARLLQQLLVGPISVGQRVHRDLAAVGEHEALLGVGRADGSEPPRAPRATPTPGPCSRHVQAQRLPEVRTTQSLQGGPPRFSFQRTGFSRFWVGTLPALLARTGVLSLLTGALAKRFFHGVTKVRLRV
jgi:hypothetical protein